MTGRLVLMLLLTLHWTSADQALNRVNMRTKKAAEKFVMSGSATRQSRDNQLVTAQSQAPRPRPPAKERLTRQQHKTHVVHTHNSQQQQQQVQQQSAYHQVNKSKPNQAKTKQKRKHSSPQQKKRDSAIYVIKLPPQPYSFVPGLGYVSRPALFSALREQPFIRPALDFVSNGKPVGVHTWPSLVGGSTDITGIGGKDSPVIRLTKGPYAWNGKAQKVYVLDSGGKPPPVVNRV